MTARRIAIGVDAGGTKTLAWVADADQARDGNAWEPIGRGHAGPGNFRAVGFDAATDAIGTAIDRALVDASVDGQPSDADAPLTLCIAAAGAGRASEQNELRRWATRRYPTATIRITDDALPVLAAATLDAVGIGLICGTGSFAWGRNESGETGRCGGWGYLLGDEGSGYAIGLAGLRAAVRAADGRGEPTELLERFLDHFQVDAPLQLIEPVYGRPLSRGDIAKLSEVVFRTAATDSVASKIVVEAARELAELVNTLSKRLGLRNQLSTLAMTGGLLVHQPSLRGALLDRIHPSFESVDVIPEPVLGAVRLASQL